MTPQETETAMREMLRDAGLDSSRPAPEQVWQVFKQFASQPVECAGDCLLFQAGDSEVQGDTYFDFCREFRLEGEEGVAWHEQLHVEFSALRPHRLGFEQTDVYSRDFGSLEEFFAEVEQLDEFRAGLSFPHWAFRVYHEGV